MTIYTVQCGYAAYYANTVVVEAESLEKALEKALEAAIGEANQDDAWENTCDCGDTFVDAVAEGEDVDPWADYSSAIPVPDRFSHQGEPTTVTLALEDGAVQAVTIKSGKDRVLVRHYDSGVVTPPLILSSGAVTIQSAASVKPPQTGQRISAPVADQKRKSAIPPGA